MNSDTTEQLYDIPSREKFKYHNQIFFILRKEGNMAEVVDASGRKWAWPLQARVEPIFYPSSR